MSKYILALKVLAIFVCVSFMPNLLAQDQPFVKAKFVVRKVSRDSGLYDVYIFYKDGKEPISAVRDNEIILTAQTNKQDMQTVTRMTTAYALGIAGLESRLKGNYVKAEETFKHSLTMAEEAGENNPALKDSLLNLAGLYLHMDKAAESEVMYRRCLKIQDTEEGTDQFERAAVLDNLAQALDFQRKYAEAEDFNQQALEMFEKMNPPQPISVAKCLSSRSFIQAGQGKFEEAKASLLKAIKLAEPVADRKQLAIFHSNLASVYYQSKMLNEALREHAMALELLEKAYGAKHPEVAVSLVNTGHVYMTMHDWKNAGNFLQRGYEIVVASQGKESNAAKRINAEYEFCLQQQR